MGDGGDRGIRSNKCYTENTTVNQQILEYIKQQLQLGISLEEIKNALLANGWSTGDVDEATRAVSDTLSVPASAPATRQTNLSLPGAGAILKDAIGIYKQRFGAFVGIMLAPTLILFVTIMTIFASVASKGLLMISFFVIAIILVLISQIWGQVALLFAVRDNQKGIGVAEAYRKGWRKILPYWWVSILIVFIINGGFLLFIIPGIIFSVWFSLAVFVFITEDIRGMNALLKSREYVRGNWGKVAWRYLFISILSLIVAIPMFVAATVDAPVIELTIRLAIYLFWLPIVAIYSFLIYTHLKVAKGEFSFSPSGKKKAFLIITGVIGFLIIPAIIFATFFSFRWAGQRAFDAQREAELQQEQQIEIFASPEDMYDILPDGMNIEAE